MAPQAKPRKFDASVLAKMIEPLAVRVERSAGGQNTPIDLPPKEDLAPGLGWSKDDIQRLESWLVREWTGGGVYDISVTDDAGTKLDWRCFYDPKTYAPRNPPTMPSSNDVALAETPPQMAAAQAASIGSATWPPPASEVVGAYAPSPPPPPAPTPRPQAPPPMMIQPPPAAPAIVNSEYEKRLLQDQLRAAHEALAKVDRERLDIEHKAELERLRQEQQKQLDEIKRSLTPNKEDSRIDKLEALIMRVLDKPSAPAGPDPTVAAMQEENRRMREEAARREERIEDQRREDARRADDQRREDARARELSEMRALILAKPSGPDPMLMMVVDMMKDSARAAQAQLDNFKQFMMTPKDIADLTKESASGADDMRRTMMGAFTDLFGMSRQVIEQAASLQPPGESTIDKAIDAAKGMAERYMGAQRDVAVSTAKAQTAQANAQAETAAASRAHMETFAQREAAARMADERGLNGFNPPENANVDAPVNGVNGANAAAHRAPVIEVVDATATEVPVVPAQAAPSDATKRYGQTDAEWFGDALPHVTALRAGVTKYFDSIHATPPKLDKAGKPLGIDAETAASNILEAVSQIVTQKVHIPAFSDLFLSQRYTEFMEVLLPGTPAQYRADVMGTVITEMNSVDDSDDEEDPDVASAEG